MNFGVCFLKSFFFFFSVISKTKKDDFHNSEDESSTPCIKKKFEWLTSNPFYHLGTSKKNVFLVIK